MEPKSVKRKKEIHSFSFSTGRKIDLLISETVRRQRNILSISSPTIISLMLRYYLWFIAANIFPREQGLVHAFSTECPLHMGPEQRAGEIRCTAGPGPRPPEASSAYAWGSMGNVDRQPIHQGQKSH